MNYSQCVFRQSNPAAIFKSSSSMLQALLQLKDSCSLRLEGKPEADPLVFLKAAAASQDHDHSHQHSHEHSHDHSHDHSHSSTHNHDVSSHDHSPIHHSHATCITGNEEHNHILGRRQEGTEDVASQSTSHSHDHEHA